jgi:hypothetical protein
VVKEELGNNVHHVVECWHRVNPFGEIVNSHNDILVTIVGWGISCHKVDAPFSKGIDGNDRVQKSLWSSSLVSEHQTLCTLFDYLNTIMEEGRTKITNMDHLLGSRYSRKFFSISVAM